MEEARDLSGGRADDFFDFTKNGRKAKPYDDYGHGTHVATLIAGNGDDSEVKVVSLKNGKKLATRPGHARASRRMRTSSL